MTMQQSQGLVAVPIYKKRDRVPPRTAARYSVNDFIDDVAAAGPLVDRVRRQAEQLLDYVRSRVNVFPFIEDVVLVGSTSPDRMTCIVDPVSPDNKYPCDFDLIVLVKEALPREEEHRVLSAVFPERTVGRMTIWNRKKTPYVEAWVNKFPIHALVWNVQRESLPLQYAQRTSLSSTAQTLTRALRLYSMRTGTYGGYTLGLKGIVLEQLAQEHECLQDALHDMHARVSGDFIVSSPVTGANLVGRVSSDVRARLARELERTTKEDSVASLPYSLDRWVDDHPSAWSLKFLSEDTDPHVVYKRVNEVCEHAARSMGIASESALLVIPQYGSNEVLVSMAVDKPYQQEFLKAFYDARDELFSAGSPDAIVFR